ncbi:MAG: hypothetical protein LC640_13405, partial [Frankia sp.]|nr:hypothetical protein [Frankia sp.]
ELVCSVAGSYYQRGDLARAHYLLERALKHGERLGTREARGSAYWNASLVAHENGQTGEAVELAGRAVALFAEGEDVRPLARVRTAYAWLLLREVPPEPIRALEMLERSAGELADVGSATDVGYCHTEMARAQLLLGDLAKAQRSAETALEHLGEESRLERASALSVLAATAVTAGDADRARELLDQATEDLTAMGATRHAATAWRELSELLDRTGRSRAAHDAAHRALDAAGVPQPVLKLGDAAPVTRTRARSARVRS